MDENELDELEVNEETAAETAEPGLLEASQGAVRVLLAAVTQLVAENMALQRQLTEALGASGTLEIVEPDGSVTTVTLQVEATAEEGESDVTSESAPTRAEVTAAVESHRAAVAKVIAEAREAATASAAARDAQGAASQSAESGEFDPTTDAAADFYDPSALEW